METRSRITLASSALAPLQVRDSRSNFSVNRLCTEKWYKQKETKVKVSNFCLTALDKSLVASCKDSIGWMFSRLDTNSDLYLDQAELAAINLDKYEVCIRPFFNSCDSYKDGKVSTAEWCLCFWRESEWRDLGSTSLFWVTALNGWSDSEVSSLGNGGRHFIPTSSALVRCSKKPALASVKGDKQFESLWNLVTKLFLACRCWKTCKLYLYQNHPNQNE